MKARTRLAALLGAVALTSGGVAIAWTGGAPIKPAGITEDSPEWDCATMGNGICAVSGERDLPDSWPCGPNTCFDPTEFTRKACAGSKPAELLDCYTYVHASTVKSAEEN
jgi:hypothetical protein